MKQITVISTLLGILILLIGLSDAYAQSQIITDRPDFTESGVSVPEGNIQIEGGIGWANFGDIEVASLPEMLVRIGIKSGLEIRLGIPDYESSEFLSGVGDASLGIKIDINSLIPGWQTAAIATVELPTGDEGIGSKYVSGDLILAGGTDLNSVYSLGSQVFVGAIGTDDGTEIEFGGTIVISRPVTKLLNSFLELATSIRDTDGTELLLHGGFTYFLRYNVQLDFHAAVGLTNDSPDSIIGAGFAVIL